MKMAWKLLTAAKDFLISRWLSGHSCLNSYSIWKRLGSGMATTIKGANFLPHYSTKSTRAARVQTCWRENEQRWSKSWTLGSRRRKKGSANDLLIIFVDIIFWKPTFCVCDGEKRALFLDLSIHLAKLSTKKTDEWIKLTSGTISVLPWTTSFSIFQSGWLDFI